MTVDGRPPGHLGAFEVLVEQTAAPVPDASPACVAGDAVPVVVVHLPEPLQGQVVRIATSSAGAAPAGRQAP